MKRRISVVALFICALAATWVVSATASTPPPNKLGPVPNQSQHPYAYGGKITALRPPAGEWAKSGGPADTRKLLLPKSPLALPTFGTDVNIGGGNEVFIASNPANPLNFIAGANINGRFTTTDGGVTWNVGSLAGGGDPVGAFDSAGRAYFTSLGNTSSCPDNPYFYKSTDSGFTWAGPTLPITDPAPTEHFFDKEWIAVDNNPTSPYLGRIYFTVSNFRTPPGCNLNNYIDVALQLVYSTNQGTTWSTPVNINDASHNQNQFTNPVAARDGTLFVGYQYQNCTFNCASNIPMVNLVAKSTNGGVSFSPSITITNQPISPTGAFVGGYQYLYAGSTASGFRHNDQAIIGVSPSNANHVYALWTDGRWDTSFVYQGVTGQHGDIAFSRSTDGGNTWSAPMRVNDDPQGNGKDQFFPWMTVGSDGVLHAAWSDRRDSTSGFQYRQYYSQSSDGGLTWATNIALADVGGTPSTFIGDYNGIAVNSDNTLVLPIWTDMRSGQRVYTDRGVMSGGGGTSTPTPIRTVTPSPTSGTCTPAWTPGPNISVARHLFQGAVGSDGMFYIFGGQTSASTATAVPVVERYNPTSNTWEPRAGLPVGVGQDSVGAIGGNIYVAGGFIGGTIVTSTLQIYNVANNTWSFGPSMPQIAEAGAGVVLDNKFYVIGGDDFNNALTNVQMFDPATNQWSSRAPLPAGRTNTSATAHGGYIYVFGGALQSGPSFVADDHLLRYDPNANSWTDLGSAGTAARGNYGTITPFGNNKLFVTDGGNSNFQPVATTHIYDIATSTWTSGPTMATARLGQAWGQLPDGRIIEAGGLGAGTPQPILSSTEILGSCGTPTNTPVVTATSTSIRTSTPSSTVLRTNTPSSTVVRTNTPTRTNTPEQSTATRTHTPVQGTATRTAVRTNTPQRTGTPCVGCSMEMLAVVTSCYMDGTVHWIAIAHNPDNCGMMAPWRAELQVRNNGGNFRAVRIQYATSYFRSGDTIMDGFFCYHFSSNVRDVRVEYLFEEQDGVSKGSKEQVQERVAPANTYSTTPDSGIPTGDRRDPNSPMCDAAMASAPMSPCQGDDSCGGGPPTPPPTGVPTRAPALPNK